MADNSGRRGSVEIPEIVRALAWRRVLDWSREVLPAKPLVLQSGTKSSGLELVDIYLWIFKRFMEGKALTRPLARLVYTNQNTARTDSVSLQSVAKRFKEFLKNCRSQRKK